MARSATTVLPEPTSPWSSRCIGWPAARSSSSASLTSCWPSVSVNGSRASKAVEQAAGRAPVRGRRPARAAGAALGQHHLEHERLVEPQPLLGRDLRPPSAGPVHAAQRLPGREEVVLAADLLGEQLGHLADQVERERDRVGDLPALHGRGGRVDRDQLRDASQVWRRPHRPPPRRTEHLVLRVGELELAAERADLAGEEPDATRAHARSRHSAMCFFLSK